MTFKNPFKYTKEEKALSDAYIRRKKSIRHLLTYHQKLMYDLLFNSEHNEIGYYCSRKIGKTASLLLMCYEFAWRNPGSLVRFVLADQTQATSIIEPMLNSFVYKFIPTDMKGKYLKSERAIRFNNGSYIKLNGANPDAVQRAVGPSCDLFVFDEIAIWEGDVKYALFDIFYPQGTLTNAKKIFSCTPPPNVSSFYIQNIHPRLVQKQSLVSLTIYENPLLSEKQITEIEEQMGGKDSKEFRRQYLCELLPTNESRVTPEFNVQQHVYTEVKEKSIEYGEQIIPQEYQYFISVDTGTVDNTAILVGYLDFHNQKLVIEEEFVKDRMNLTEIAEEIHHFTEKYSSHFYEGDTYLKIIVDAFSLEKKELREIHGINLISPIKCKVEDNVAHLRSALANNKIEIHKDCTRLIWELENCVWKESVSDNKQIERNVTQKHGDAIMSLTYMLRAVNWRFKPGQKTTIQLHGHNPRKNTVENLKNQYTKIWGNLHDND